MTVSQISSHLSRIIKDSVIATIALPLGYRHILFQ